MKMIINHKIFTYIIIICTIIVSVSCDKKMDDYKKYIGDKLSITYTGKVDSVKVYSGKNRVLIKGLLVSDPKIKEARIYWDGRRDSLVIPITRTLNVDTLKASIENLEDRVYNFEIVTFDSDGNKSVKVNAFGRSYGENYQLSIINRPVASNSLNTRTNIFDVNFGNVDKTLGIFATELKYKLLSGQEKTVRIGIDQLSISLNDVKIDEFSYRSLYLPDTLCLDTFYTEYTHFNPALKFELKNANYPFARSSWDGSRWGIPADWIVNAATKNAGNNTYGGYEYRSSNGALSLEGGWGLPAVVNGKIYQSIELPAGNYKLTVDKYEKGSAGVVNLVVSDGSSEIPNEADLNSAAIAYSSFAAGTTSKELNFTITTSGVYNIGFLGNMPNTGSYIKILGNVRLETR